ncbi:MAG: NAD(P)-dependent oxidoreductase, partial [Clostridia bacterium]|nr:NAD(P)-dependent oxidoreductase [Clostridia bacterium]
MKEKIILLGSAGYLGRYFLDYLMKNIDKEKYEIVATGRSKKYPFSFYKGEYIQLDITKKDDFERLPQKNVKAVVDFAGVLPAYYEEGNPYKYIDVNITGTLNVLEYCREVKADRIIYTHTKADLYGYLNQDEPLKPDLPRKPILKGDHAIYVVSKCAAVDLIECYHNQYGIKNFIFRLTNIYLYSPDMYYYVNGKKQLVSYRYIINKAIKGEDIELWGNPEFGKDIVYIKDFCQMVFKSLFVDRNTGLYNVGTGVK